MCFFNRFLMIALLLLEIAEWMPGIEMVAYIAMRLFAAGVGLINASIRPLMLLASIPINLFTVGLIAFILNGVVFWAMSGLYLGIHVATFSGGFFAFLIIWAASTIANRWIYIETTNF
jgi:putative membrane protein